MVGFAAVVILASACSNGQDSAGIDMETLIHEVEQAQDSITSGMCNVTYTFETNEPPKGPPDIDVKHQTMKFMFIFEGEKYRVDGTVEQELKDGRVLPPRDIHAIFDGDSLYTFNMEVSGEDTLIRGSVSANNPLHMGDNANPLLYVRYVNAQRYDAFLRGEKNRFGQAYENIRITGTDKVDGVSCVVVQGDAERGNLTLKFAPERMYLVKQSRFNIVENPNYVLENRTFSEYDGDIWFLDTAEREIREDRPGPDKVLARYMISIADFSPNPQLTEGVFVMNFPENAVIRRMNPNARGNQ